MEVVTLNNEVFSQKCTELADKVDFKPDLVVVILRGGGYVASKIKGYGSFKPVRFEFVKPQRSSKLKDNKIAELLFKILPYSVLNWLRILESKSLQKNIDSQTLNGAKKSKKDFNFSSKETLNNILILDDAIDTGESIFVVKNSLKKMFPNSQIKTAVISWTINASIIKPDFYIFKNVLVRFPWSKDYKGKDFEQKSFSS